MSNPTQQEQFNADFSAVKTAEFHQQLSEQAGEMLFENPQDAENTAKTIVDFIDDYLANGRNQAIKPWLLSRFDQFPDIWESEQEKQDTAEVIISTVDNLVSNQLALEKHLQKGRSIENFIQRKVQETAEKTTLAEAEIYQQLDNALDKDNGQFAELLTGQAMDLQPISHSEAEKIVNKHKLNAHLNLASYGLKMVSNRIKNALQGKENPSRTEELLNILRASIDSAENKGIQVAMSGGVVVSAKKVG